MHTIYSFVIGPLAWASFAVFFFGLAARFIQAFILARKTDAGVFHYLNLKYALRSIAVWSIPFATHNMRRHPYMTLAAFTFHIAMFAVALFLPAHVMLLKEGFFGISWWAMPDVVADGLTIVIVACLVFFTVRRVLTPEARYVSRPRDYALLALTAAPFITGILAYHQVFNYQLMVILHIVSGELVLMAIPFTWLSHMIMAPLIRAYMGSEFGMVRHARDW